MSKYQEDEQFEKAIEEKKVEEEKVEEKKVEEKHVEAMHTEAMHTEEKQVEEPKKRKGKPLTPEHKAKLLEGLKQARLRKAEIKLSKDEKLKNIKMEVKQIDEKVVEKIVENVVKPIIDPKDIEIKELRKKLEGLTLQDVVKPKPKRKAKPKTIIEEDEDKQSSEEKHIEDKPKKKKYVKKIGSIQEIASHVQQIQPIIFKSLRGSKMRKR